MRQSLAKTLKRLKVEGLPHCAWADVFTLKDGGGLTDIDQATLTEYFGRFLPPREACVGCGGTLVGKDIIEVAIGAATFEWGLVNGEGHCRRCGWPARAYHREVGPIKFLNFVLQYHPDELEITAKEA
mgnify:FL=1